MKKIISTEPLWWGLFAAGGMISAMLVPIHIALTGLAVPLGWLSEPQVLYQHWLVKLYLFVLIALSFFHCGHRIYHPLFHFAHRVYHSLPDFALRVIRKPIAVLVYGGALTGTVATVWILLG
jgi:fumarate reductase subunit D